MKLGNKQAGAELWQDQLKLGQAELGYIKVLNYCAPTESGGCATHITSCATHITGYATHITGCATYIVCCSTHIAGCTTHIV